MSNLVDGAAYNILSMLHRINTWEKLLDYAKNYSLAPRFHGNGFTQLYLTESMRLHVWHPDLLPSRVQNARIHDHKFDMVSHVIAGCLRHTSYEVSGHNHDATFGVWEAPGASKGDRLQYTHERVIPTVRECIHMSAGTDYFFRARRYHDSAGLGLTATLMRKANDGSKAPARILVENGLHEDYHVNHAFDNQPPESDLWDAIRELYQQKEWTIC